MKNRRTNLSIMPYRPFLLLVLLILATCRAAGQTSAPPAEPQFTFSLERQPPKTIVRIQSVKKYPCKGYLLDTRDYENADTTIIMIRDVIPPFPCNGPKETATEQFILEPSAKRFYLKLWHKGQYDKWRIFQLDTAYLVRPEGVTFSTYSGPLQ